MSSRPVRFPSRGLLAPAVLDLGLLVPEREPPAPQGARERPFLWDRDTFRESLESGFEGARSSGCLAVEAHVRAILEEPDRALLRLAAECVTPEDADLDAHEKGFFGLVPRGGVRA